MGELVGEAQLILAGDMHACQGLRPETVTPLLTRPLFSAPSLEKTLPVFTNANRLRLAFMPAAILRSGCISIYP